MPIWTAQTSSLQVDAALDTGDGMKLHGRYSPHFVELRRNSDRRCTAMTTRRTYFLEGEV